VARNTLLEMAVWVSRSDKFACIGDVHNCRKSTIIHRKVTTVETQISVWWLRRENLRLHRKGIDMSNKEKIVPPSKKDLKDASKEMKKGHGAGGRTMSDASVAKKQGATRPKK
jgi:hypothetical protein